MRILLLVYNLLFPVVLVLLLPGALLRMMRRGNYAHKFGQRFACYSARTRARLRTRKGEWIWIHAVSVGEVNIALKFIRHLQSVSDQPVLLSTTTSTGFALAQERKSKTTEVIYHPVDFFLTAKRAVALIQPKALVLVEAEIWPNLVNQVHRIGSPVILLNARLSRRSEARFRRFHWLVSHLFSQVDHVCLQEEADRPRFASLGVLPQKMSVTGSVKFDPCSQSETDSTACHEFLSTLGIGEAPRILLAASTHSGEERVMAEIYTRIRKDFPGLFLVVVPRHMERGGAVAAEITSLGLAVRRRSLPAGETPPDVLVIDSTGELPSWTALAELVFVGKSLLARGGQNPAEAIAFHRPLVFGPEMQNFSGLVRLILGVDGGKQVGDAAELEETLQQLLLHPALAKAMAERAHAALEPHSGATARSADVLQRLLAHRPGGMAGS